MCYSGVDTRLLLGDFFVIFKNSPSLFGTTKVSIRAQVLSHGCRRLAPKTSSRIDTNFRMHRFLSWMTRRGPPPASHSSHCTLALQSDCRKCQYAIATIASTACIHCLLPLLASTFRFLLIAPARLCGHDFTKRTQTRRFETFRTRISSKKGCESK